MIDVWGSEPQTLDELAQCVIAALNQQPIQRTRSRVRVLGLAWELRWGMVSNSHYAPIAGVTNWSRRDPGLPTGYPGWTGRVWVRYATRINVFGSDPFQYTLTYPGTGGWGAYSGPWSGLYHLWYTQTKESAQAYPEPQIYSWDYRIFGQDWPAVARSYEAQDTWAALQGQTVVHATHRFRWEDPSTNVRDQAFMDSLKETA